MERQVTERDFRQPEFYHAKPEDYEFRKDGKIVRKDRWETGIRKIVGILEMSRGDFEIEDVVKAVRDREEAWRHANKLCHICAKPATCLGAYEGQTKQRYGCDNCCGHGCEDGKCERLPDVPAPIFEEE